MATVEHVSATAPGAGGRASQMPRLGFHRRRFDKYLALGKYGFPFAIGRYAGPVGQFRGLARTTRFAGRARHVRALAALVMTLGWPFGAFATALRTCRQARLRGVHYGVRQFTDMYWLAIRYSIPPLEYALYRFEDPARRKDIHEYVYWNDLPGLGALIARTGADSRDVQDKDRFANICATHGFPHVPTLAVFDAGKQKFPAMPFVPDAPVLWTKSLRLKQGAGAAKWTRHGDSYCNKEGRIVPATHLAQQFCRQDCIVQPFVENHPELATVSTGTLAPLRIVTGMNDKGDAEFVTALIGFADEVREISVAVILCSVDPDTGRIRRAVRAWGERVTRHPDSGSAIEGICLPYCRESIDLVRRAHAGAFSRFPFLGWDVALTKDGPLLLETNAGWGAIFEQMLDGPLGHTAFSRLVRNYM